MAITRLTAANAISGTLPAANINSTSLGNVDVGKVLQVVQGTHAGTLSITTQSYVDTGLSASITPSSTSNKVLVLIDFNIEQITSGNSANGVIDRNGTHVGADPFGIYSNSNVVDGETFSHSYLDSPSSTSALTYKFQMKNEASGYTTKYGSASSGNSAVNTMILMEVSA